MSTRDEYLQCLKDVLRTRPGRVVFNHILKGSDIGDTGMFTGNSQTFYRLGQHDSVAALLKDIEQAAPEISAEMYKERLSNE